MTIQTKTDGSESKKARQVKKEFADLARLTKKRTKKENPEIPSEPIFEDVIRKGRKAAAEKAEEMRDSVPDNGIQEASTEFEQTFGPNEPICSREEIEALVASEATHNFGMKASENITCPACQRGFTPGDTGGPMYQVGEKLLCFDCFLAAKGKAASGSFVAPEKPKAEPKPKAEKKEKAEKTNPMEGLLSNSDIAKIHGRAVSEKFYGMCRNGFCGFKVGKQWAIKKADWEAIDLAKVPPEMMRKPGSGAPRVKGEKPPKNTLQEQVNRLAEMVTLLTDRVKELEENALKQ